MSRSVIWSSARRRTSVGRAGPARVLWLAPILLAALGPAFLVRAADPQPPADEPKPAPAEKPLSFTDEDLEKYKKHPPVPPGADTAAPAGATQAPVPAPVPAAAKGAPGAKPAPPTTLEPVPKRPPGATPATLAPPAAPVRPPAAARPGPATRPAVMAPPPGEDPLKRWKDREELETFRQGQLESLRTQITGLESRLEYLNLKRLSILDPTRIMPKPQTDDDRATDQGKGSRELLSLVEKEIETTEADLRQAKEALINIETRFAQESGRP
jgi:hypothetical protein